MLSPTWNINEGCEGNCGIRQDIWDLDEKSAEAEFYQGRTQNIRMRGGGGGGSRAGPRTIEYGVWWAARGRSPGKILGNCVAEKRFLRLF